jgi:hypothetical protein
MSLVLAQGAGPGLAHGQQALGSVAAHAGQDHPDHRTLQPDDGVEQHIHGRAMAVDRFRAHQAAAGLAPETSRWASPPGAM